MILIGLGSNVPGPWGGPEETLKNALKFLDVGPCKMVEASTLITTKPFGLKNQPDFVNGVARIETDLAPDALMSHLHDIELSGDRRRTVRWGPRTLDLDLLDYNGLILTGEGESFGHQSALILPHPGIALRSFVLEPIAEIAPDWKHPVLGSTARELLLQIA